MFKSNYFLSNINDDYVLTFEELFNSYANSNYKTSTPQKHQEQLSGIVPKLRIGNQ